jgi:hypothetical protein
MVYAIRYVTSTIKQGEELHQQIQHELDSMKKTMIEFGVSCVTTHFQVATDMYSGDFSDVYYAKSKHMIGSNLQSPRVPRIVTLTASWCSPPATLERV